MKQQLRKPTHNRLLPVRAKSRRHAWQLMSRVIPLVVLSIASCWWMLAMSPAMGQFPSPPSTTPAPFQPVNQNFNASGTDDSINGNSINRLSTVRCRTNWINRPPPMQRVLNQMEIARIRGKDQ